MSRHVKLVKTEIKHMRPHSYFALAAVAALLSACTNEVSSNSDVIPPENKFDEEYYKTSSDTSVTGCSENVTFCTATLTGKINNLGGAQNLPSGSTFGILLSSSSSDPRYGEDGVTEIRSSRRALVYSCEATGLNMGTVYYYRSFFRNGRTRQVFHGRVFAFCTEQCNVMTVSPSQVGFCSAVVGGRSGVKVNQTSFKGAFGVVFTSRQTDRPNVSVDNLASGYVPSGDSVAFKVDLENLAPGTRYLYQAYLKIDTAYYFGSVMSFTTKSLSFSDGDVPVDLGLSVRWASRNVGASGAHLAGTYFPYGDPTGEMMETDYLKYPNSDIVASEFDMATVNLGVGWQLPSFEQCKELADDCDWLWTTYKDVQGYAVMSRDGSAAIFLPACGYSYVVNDSTRAIAGYDISEPQGYYWTGSRSTISSKNAYSLMFSQGKVNAYNLGNKSYGFCVRPVAE